MKILLMALVVTGLTSTSIMAGTERDEHGYCLTQKQHKHHPWHTHDQKTGQVIKSGSCIGKQVGN